MFTRTLLCLTLLSATACVHVSRYTDIAYAPTSRVVVLHAPPAQPYTEIGELSIGEGSLAISRLLDKARAMGADALWIQGVTPGGAVFTNNKMIITKDVNAIAIKFDRLPVPVPQATRQATR